jgi:hypothetical protein
MDNPRWISSKLKRKYSQLSPQEKGEKIIEWFKEGISPQSIARRFQCKLSDVYDYLKLVDMKRCGKCKDIQSYKEFSKDKHKPDGHKIECKTCTVKRLKKWTSENKKHIAAKANERYHNDINRKVSVCFSSMIYYALKQQKNGMHWENIVGYTLDNLMHHLESLFQDGMSWDNYGSWEIDHIRPITSFTFQSYEDKEFKECWKLQNLQPLWAKENKVKQNFIGPEWGNI